MRGVRVELPAAAQVKYNLLDVARMVSEDAVRAAQSRLSGLGPGADSGLVAQLTRERDRHAARHRALAALGHKINEWLMRLPANAVLEMMPAADIKLRDGETWIDAIEATRKDVSSLQGQLQVVRAAPLPLDDQRQAVAAYVERLGRQAQPAVSVVQNGTLRVGFRDVLVEAEQTLALLAWIDPEKVRDALTGLLEGAPRVVGAMGASEKQQRLAELEAKLLELERAEEALVEQANKSGIDILRRPDASPPCVLGVIVKARAAKPQVQVVA
jgi:hypothetical protein